MKGTTVKTKKGRSCYIQGDKVATYGGYSYTTLSGVYYGGWLSSKVYTTYSAALTACSANSKCTVSLLIVVTINIARVPSGDFVV